MHTSRLLNIGVTGREFASIPASLVCLLLFVACAPSQPSSVVTARPACVDLWAYNGVIEQVMGMQPDWESPAPTAQGYESQWVIRDHRGIHTLTAAMTAQGCVCATNAMSRFRGAYAQGETAGLLQGAAVAPVSELEYTSRWLDPRIFLRCPLAFLLRSKFESEAEMPDGTTWKLTCSGSGALGEVELATMFTVLTPQCLNAFQ